MWTVENIIRVLVEMELLKGLLASVSIVGGIGVIIFLVMTYTPLGKNFSEEGGKNGSDRSKIWR